MTINNESDSKAETLNPADAYIDDNTNNSTTNDIENLSKNTHAKKTFIICVFAIVGILLIILGVFIINNASSFESRARKYVNKLEFILGENIEVIDAVCYTNIMPGDKSADYAYLIVYKCNNTIEYAYFSDGDYLGNGNNGGFDKNDGVQIFNNIETNIAIQFYQDYLNGTYYGDIITEQDARNNIEGLLPLDIEKLK